MAQAQSIRYQIPTLLKCYGLAFILSGSLASLVTPYMLAATFSYICMLLGIIYRRNRNVHVSLMNTAILLDLIVVLVLEFQRDAIDTALSMSLSPLQQLHIGFSSLATVFYIPTLIFGYRRLLKKEESKALTQKIRKLHLRSGIIAFVFRTIGFILMFSLISHVTHS